jgi:hypothetical protein
VRRGGSGRRARIRLPLAPRTHPALARFSGLSRGDSWSVGVPDASSARPATAMPRSSGQRRAHTGNGAKAAALRGISRAAAAMPSLKSCTRPGWLSARSRPTRSWLPWHGCRVASRPSTTWCWLVKIALDCVIVSTGLLIASNCRQLTGCCFTARPGMAMSPIGARRSGHRHDERRAHGPGPDPIHPERERRHHLHPPQHTRGGTVGVLEPVQRAWHRMAERDAS